MAPSKAACELDERLLAQGWAGAVRVRELYLWSSRCWSRAWVGGAVPCGGASLFAVLRLGVIVHPVAFWGMDMRRVEEDVGAEG